MSALVLDTHAWVWWVSKPEKLSRKQRSAIDRARNCGGDPRCDALPIVVDDPSPGPDYS